MCIVTASTENEHQLGFRCACNIGWMLASDQRNCYCKLFLHFYSYTSCPIRSMTQFIIVIDIVYSGTRVPDVIPAEVHQGTYFRSCY